MKITVDAMLRQKLQNLSEPAEFVDESGKVLGRYFPHKNGAQYIGREPPISDEELEMLRAEKGKGQTYTTAEVIAYLERL